MKKMSNMMVGALILVIAVVFVGAAVYFGGGLGAPGAEAIARRNVIGFCSDPDGQDLTVAGTCTSGTNSATDTCGSSEWIVESYCMTRNSCGYMNASCVAAGHTACSEGRCI